MISSPMKIDFLIWENEGISRQQCFGRGLWQWQVPWLDTILKSTTLRALIGVESVTAKCMLLDREHDHLLRLKSCNRGTKVFKSYGLIRKEGCWWLKISLFKGGLNKSFHEEKGQLDEFFAGILVDQRLILESWNSLSCLFSRLISAE